MPFKIPTSRKIREKKFSEGVWREKGVRRGNVRTSNPNSASRVRSGTFFSVV